MKTFSLCSVIATALLACTFNAFAQQTIEFASINGKQGLPAIREHHIQYSDKISGVLQYPTGATGKVPAMVIMHSSGGINESTWQWSKFFLDMGVATLVVDSFKPRGIDTTTTNQAQLTPVASAVDALIALKTVAAQPGIDPARIGVIGFSRGGFASLMSSFETVRSGVLGPDSKLAFALHVVFYGGCINYATTTGAPMLFFVGEKDDYYSVKTCKHMVENMRGKGANIVNSTVYPGVTHGFDVERDKQLYIGNAEAYNACGNLSIDNDDQTYYKDHKPLTSKEFGEAFGKCITHGATVSYNYKAMADSRAQTKALLTKVFGL